MRWSGVDDGWAEGIADGNLWREQTERVHRQLPEHGEEHRPPVSTFRVNVLLLALATACEHGTSDCVCWHDVATEVAQVHIDEDAPSVYALRQLLMTSLRKLSYFCLTTNTVGEWMCSRCLDEFEMSTTRQAPQRIVRER